MILKSITLIGFKSFARKTTIDVSKNVTGIVGPNGSGKSNIAEAIRFVVGEQSMKSIRSKSMGDLVFKGSEHVAPLSRASVSIEIDNKSKIYNEGVSPEISKFLAYDELILSREVYVDGGSTYKINGAEVRLKDVQSLLALAGIGASAHTIISQGEADKILMSNSIDRREMIEDALGLKIHQIRIKDSEKKREKISEHIRTAEQLRRELAPNLTNLKNQVEKINKLEVERTKLYDAYLNYFVYENKYIEELKSKSKDISLLKNDLAVKRTVLAELKASELTSRESDNDNNVRDSELLKLNQIFERLTEERYTLDREISEINFKKREISIQLERLASNVNLRREDLYTFKKSILEVSNDIKDIISQQDFEKLQNVDLKIKDIISSTDKWSNETPGADYSPDDLKVLDEKINSKQQGILEIKTKLTNIKLEIGKHQESRVANVKSYYDEIYNLEREIANIEKSISEADNNALTLQASENNYLAMLDEATKIIGERVLNYKSHTLADNYKHGDNEKLIIRLKIRIEEIGILDPRSIMSEYENLHSQDEHLRIELEDLHKTGVSLDEVISELEENIKNDFARGIEKINFNFNNLFHEVFPGGRASIVQERVLSKNELDEDTSDVINGINLTISLPGKKIHDMNMLSGGEKTLVSIALLFALTSITPPPFMVLDETDAALDELNAKKYGKLLSKLAEKSRLLVITHNRETMNECDVLYGVTVGGDGTSKILSIKFD